MRSNNTPIIFETIIASTYATEAGFVTDYESAEQNLIDFNKIAELFIKQHGKEIASIGEFRRQITTNNYESKISVVLVLEADQAELFNDISDEYRNIFKEYIQSTQKVFDISSKIMDRNLKPSLKITQSKTDEPNKVAQENENTITINNKFTAQLANVLNKQNNEQIHIEVGGEPIALPKPPKKIFSEKISDRTTPKRMKIKIMSVNNDDAYFRFKETGNPKKLKGRYENLETRRKLLLAQLEENQLCVDFFQTSNTGFLSQDDPIYELASITE
jgi:hypothetical protein